MNVTVHSGPGLFWVDLGPANRSRDPVASHHLHLLRIWPIEVRGRELIFLTRKGWTLLMVQEWLRACALVLGVIFETTIVSVDGSPIYQEAS